MNKVILAGEITDLKENNWNNRTYNSFVLETRESYKDKHTGQDISWSTRIKCNYENTNFSGKIGDTVLVEGKISVRGIESEKGKVWVTEVKCQNVNVIVGVPKKSFNYGPPPLDRDAPPF